MSKYLTPKEVGEILGIGRSTVYRLLKEGLPSIRVRGQWRVEKASLDKWLEAQERWEEKFEEPLVS